MTGLVVQNCSDDPSEPRSKMQNLKTSLLFDFGT